jgi:hypothetical protein
MSGLEALGVVLGVLPLVISALGSYAEGVQTIRRMLRCKWELDTLITTLETEEVLFRNTCEVLLEGIGGPVEMEELLKNPGGHLWKKGELGERLETRLSTSYAVFFKRIVDMKDALESFKMRIGLDQDGKVSAPFFVNSLRNDTCRQHLMRLCVTCDDPCMHDPYP